MAEKDPSKTEDATTKRLNKTREDGNVAKGQEITKVMTLLAGILALRSMIGFYHDQFIEIYQWTFREAIYLTIDQPTVYALFTWSLKKMMIIVLPFLLILFFTAILVLRLQVGNLWSTKVLEPKFGKIFNVVAGLKRLMLSPDALVKLLRSIAQAFAVGIAPYIVIKQEIPNLVPLFYSNTYGVVSYLLAVGYKTACYALVPMMLIGIIDLWYTRWKYAEDLKMTKDEVKDERKQSEGDPQIKQQQQQKMMAMMASRMFQDIPKADVVITNPTHFAVALQYNVMVAPAPMILAKGVNRVAERIKEVARENDVPIEQNPPLARALYKQVEIGETIPEELFQAVAAILAKLDKFKNRQ